MIRINVDIDDKSSDWIKSSYRKLDKGDVDTDAYSTTKTKYPVSFH